ncbi:MAG TPA: hypothetical protein ENG87_03860 [Candidatus Pacearchaeota archaeon]|nr:hypothetical protein [Candidatus Pacearchaeota archaeon]
MKFWKVVNRRGNDLISAFTPFMTSDAELQRLKDKYIKHYSTHKRVDEGFVFETLCDARRFCRCALFNDSLEIWSCTASRSVKIHRIIGGSLESIEQYWSLEVARNKELKTITLLYWNNAPSGTRLGYDVLLLEQVKIKQD